MLELSDVELKGRGKLTDPETSKKDYIELEAPLDLCQVVMSLDTVTEYDERLGENVILPKFDITDVAMTLKHDAFKVSSSGDLPVYRSS